MQITEIITDETLREIREHGTPEFPFEYYLDDIDEIGQGYVEWHWHNEIEWAWVESGKVICRIGNEKIILEAGEGIFINSRVIHRFETPGGALMPNILHAPELLAARESAIYQKYVSPVITYGKEYVGHVHQKNGKNTQDAHEAIRPTNIHRTPESIKDHLTNDQYRLYSLIYARTLASLMKDAVYDVTSVKITNNDLEFSASGQTMTFDGYYKVYSKYEKQSDALLPKLEENEVLKNVTPTSKQHFTEPPARYTEARLIKDLEEKSIGRPSTYATIIDTLQKRGYASLEKASETSKTKVFIPSEQGILTNEKLQQYFSSVINVEYTADMEKTLDEIAEGNEDSVSYMHKFYDKFAPLVEDAYEKMPKKELERVGRTCPECGGELVYRNGRFGKFISCINFPTCRYTENDEEELPEEAKEEKICPNCGAKMVIKRGRYGQFWACSNYPECKTIESLKKKAKPEPTGEMCPECGHELVRRKSRFGTTFIGCSNYPKCHYIKKEPKKTEEDK